MADINTGFTEAERNRIDEFHRNEFHNMSAEDVELYGRWKAASAAAQASIDAKTEQLTEIAQLRLQLACIQADASTELFSNMYQAALARLDAVNEVGADG